MTDQTCTVLPRRDGDVSTGFVYFAYSAGRIKIGYSRGTAVRQQQLATAGPIDPVMILLIHGGPKDEAALHVQFAEERVRGEWFVLSDHLRVYLSRRLCDIGRASLDRCETEFKAYCEAFLCQYKAPSPAQPKTAL
jgi:hypothetical protein